LDLERVIWDEDFSTAIRLELDRRGCRRPLVVVSPSCRKASAEVRDFIESGTGLICGVFDAIIPHVDRASVIALVEMCRRTKPDLIVTVGGGSPIDTVKVALLMMAAGACTDDELTALGIRTSDDGVRLVPFVPASVLRQIVVPTTLAGAEFSDLAGATDRRSRIKQLFTGKGIGSASVIFDQAITLSTPIQIWLSTGIRALDHAVETLCSAGSNPYADALSTEAIGRLAASLRKSRAHAADLAARKDAQFAVWLACVGLNRVPWGASHGIGHQLGAVAQVPHGYCSCILLPHVLAFNKSFNTERQTAVARALGSTDGDAARAVAQLVADLGLPRRLRDVGVTPDMMSVVAETSLENAFVRQNPRPIKTSADVMQILQHAY
jgi:alcohol dehydrogenase class IV